MRKRRSLTFIYLTRLATLNAQQMASCNQLIHEIEGSGKNGTSRNGSSFPMPATSRRRCSEGVLKAWMSILRNG